MNNYDNDIELIESFLDKKLSEIENIQFNERLNADAAFNELYLFRLKIQDRWNEANEFESTKSYLNNIHMKSISNKSNRNYYWAIAVAAMFMLIVPLVIKFNTNSNQLQVNDLEQKATIEFLDQRYKQIYPVQGQILKSGNIVFNWESALDVKTAIILTEMDSKEVYIISPITSDQKKYVLKDTMPPGKYEWKMEGFKGTKMFIVK